ncbi:MAG: hypothetical protein ACLPYY_07755 [Acidimicrobiales bacterium]
MEAKLSISELSNCQEVTLVPLVVPRAELGIDPVNQELAKLDVDQQADLDGFEGIALVDEPAGGRIGNDVPEAFSPIRPPPSYHLWLPHSPVSAVSTPERTLHTARSSSAMTGSMISGNIRSTPGRAGLPFVVPASGAMVSPSVAGSK